MEHDSAQYCVAKAAATASAAATVAVTGAAAAAGVAVVAGTAVGCASVTMVAIAYDESNETWKTKTSSSWTARKGGVGR